MINLRKCVSILTLSDISTDVSTTTNQKVEVGGCFIEGEICCIARKIIASDFWDSQCVMLVDYYKEGKPSVDSIM